ncbi:HAD hydrolase-like protein [bacterium]|nr:HAD hydrolase-like protein [bacterium]
MPTLIVFDIDGTLTDTVDIHQTAFLGALEKMGVSEINSNLNSFIHHTDSFIAKTIYEDALNSQFSAVHLNQFEKLLFAGVQKAAIQEIPGAKELLKFCLNQNELYFTYATGSLYQPALLKLNEISAPMSNYNLHSSNDMHSREEIVNSAIEAARKEHQVDTFSRIISIGDGKWDYKTAENLGLEFIGLGSAEFNTFGKYPVGLHLEHWKDLRSLFNFLNL